MHWKVGVNTVKTLKLEKGGGCMTPPVAGGAAPATTSYTLMTTIHRYMIAE